MGKEVRRPSTRAEEVLEANKEIQKKEGRPKLSCK